MEAFQYKIIGTSHVAKESVENIKKEIKEFQPDIVCIELDANRLQGLLSNQKSNFNPKMIGRIGLTGYIFGLIGHMMQKKVGEKLNIIPGKDMLTAYKVAKAENKDIKLIDQDVQATLRNVSKNFTWKEKRRLFGQIFEAIFFKKRAIEKNKEKLQGMNFDLNTVPSEEIVEKMILSLKDEYPGLYKAIVDDRNKIMANRIYLLLKKNPTKKVLAIVGAGHKTEMEKIINKKLQNLEYFPKKIEYNYTYIVSNSKDENSKNKNNKKQEENKK